MGPTPQHIVTLGRNKPNMLWSRAVYTEGVGDSSPSPLTNLIKPLGHISLFYEAVAGTVCRQAAFWEEHDESGTRPRWSVTRLQNGYDVVGGTLKKKLFFYFPSFYKTRHAAP